MSKKFEQLLDLVVNEEMDKANELFHEIVVEMSREIYENMIAEEAQDEMDDTMEEGMDEYEESMYGDEGMEEETTMEIGGDKADDFLNDVDVDPDKDDMDDMGDDMGDMGDDMEDSDERISDLEDALEELKAEFEALMADEKDEPEHADMFGDESDSDQDDEDDDDAGDDDMEKKPAMEARRMTREYREKVSDGHGAEKKGAAEHGGVNKHSPVSSAKDRPTTKANAHNIAQGDKGTGEMTGQRPNGKSGGLAGAPKGEYTSSGTHNVNGVKSGVKTLKAVKDGHGAEKKGHGETSVNDKPVVGG
jgi:hypothetical protein